MKGNSGDNNHNDIVKYTVLLFSAFLSYSLVIAGSVLCLTYGGVSSSLSPVWLQGELESGTVVAKYENFRE